MPEAGDLTEADRSILATADGALQRVTEAIDEFAIHRALEVIWALVADANRYFAGEEPWAHKKTNTKRMETILYVTAEVTRRIAILVQPVMPDSAGRLLDQLGVGKEDGPRRRFAIRFQRAPRRTRRRTGRPLSPSTSAPRAHRTPRRTGA